MIRKRYDMVLCLFPNARGLAYVALEGPLSPYDWGVSDIYGKQKGAKSLLLVGRILKRLSPDVLVLRGFEANSRRRQNREAIKLVQGIEKLAAQASLPIATITRSEIRETFRFLGDKPSRFEIALAIAKRVVQFEIYLPRPRKIWESEDRWMGLFDAVALGLTFFRMNQLTSSRAKTV